MEQQHPAVKKALEGNRTTVVQSFSVPIEIFEQLLADAEAQRRSVSQLTSFILEEHYARQQNVAA